MDQTVLVVFHDNGVKGQRGYTEYLASEINLIGGIDALRDDYASHGVVIYDIF